MISSLEQISLLASMTDGLTPDDEGALLMLASEMSGKDKIFIEIGSWKGHSASILGMVMKRDGGKVFCIDHWQGSPGLPHHTREKDCFNVFRSNMKDLELDDIVHPLIMDSAIAAKILGDEVADMIFIDADHRYDSAKQDIDLWWPKVKPGGILCGHDCEGYYSKYAPRARERIDETRDEDYQLDIRCHSGVIKALGDCFGEDYSIRYNSTIWYKRKDNL